MKATGRSRGRLGWAALLLAALAVSPWSRADAAGLTFTVTAPSAFLRAEPAFGAVRMYSVFAGQSYPVAGRTEDATWVLLSFPGATPGTTWIPASYGQVDGNLGLAPVTAAAPLPAPTASAASAATAPANAGPAGPVHYTVAVRSLFGRQGPSASSARLVSLFQGQRFAAVARSADGQWLQLSLPGGGAAWVPAAYGTVTGSAALLPVGGASPPAASASPPPSSVAPPSVSQRAREIYQAGLALGNRANAFSKIGDCNSVGPYFLAPFDRGEYRLGPYAHLQGVISQFAGSFGRDGAAAMDGMNVTSMYEPIWADPRVCQPGESPLACELRLHQPSLALISLGTNGAWHSDQEYETYLRRILDDLIARGVLPILSTKADNLEGGDRFNHIVRRLAGEYDLPLWDFAATARALPNGGLADSYRLTWGQAYYDTAPQPYTGWQARNLTALQALDAVWRAVQ